MVEIGKRLELVVQGSPLAANRHHLDKLDMIQIYRTILEGDVHRTRISRYMSKVMKITVLTRATVRDRNDE